MLLEMNRPGGQWPYQNKWAMMTTYSEKHLQVYPHDFLLKLYLQFAADGTLEIMFPGLDMSHANKFISYISAKASGVCICSGLTENKSLVVGMGWLAEVAGTKETGRSGSFGFGFFRSAWGKRVHIDLSMWMLAYWMLDLNFEVLYGSSFNPIALNYSKRFGFKYLTRLPKFFYSYGRLLNAHLICLEKPVFLEYYKRWQSVRG